MYAQVIRQRVLSSVLGMLALLALPCAAQAAPLVKTSEPPRFVADLSADFGSTTYFFPRRQTAFSLELSPRFGFTLVDFVDLGLNFVAGYGSGVKSWSQATMFGIGPYVGLRFALTPNWRLVPWLGVMYHQTFLDGFTPGPATNTDENFTAVRQVVRVDAHVDAVFRPQSRTAFTVGLFAKTRVASFDPGLGSSPEVSAGIRVGAISFF